MSVELIAILVAGVIAVNLVVAWLLARRDHDVEEFLDTDAWGPPDRSVDANRFGGPDTPPGFRGPDGPETDPPPLSADGDTVVCRHCGAENRPGYRYCRWCVRSGFFEDDRSSTAEPSATRRPF